MAELPSRYDPSFLPSRDGLWNKARLLWPSARKEERERLEQDVFTHLVDLVDTSGYSVHTFRTTAIEPQVRIDEQWFHLVLRPRQGKMVDADFFITDYAREAQAVYLRLREGEGSRKEALFYAGYNRHHAKKGRTASLSIGTLQAILEAEVDEEQTQRKFNEAAGKSRIGDEVREIFWVTDRPEMSFKVRLAALQKTNPSLSLQGQ